MVKQLALFLCSMVHLYCFSQNLSMGLGASANVNQVRYQPTFNFDLRSVEGDTLILQTKSVSIQKSISLPIFARFSSKRNWWIQANYGYQTWRLGIQSETNATDYYIANRVNERLAESWSIYTGDLDSIAFRNEFYEIYEQDEADETQTELNGFERLQYNQLSVVFGSLLNRKGAIKFYYGLGADFMIPSTLESYRGMTFDTERFNYQNEILAALPRLRQFQIAPRVLFGLERQNLRIGFDFSFFPFSTINNNALSLNNVVQPNRSYQTTITSISTFGVHLDYTFFNQNFNQRISVDKRSDLNPKVIGRYREKPNFVQVGATINFPSLHNSGQSIIEAFNLEDKNASINSQLEAEDDTYLTGRFIEEDNLNDFLYIEKEDETIFVNEDGIIDTNVVFTTLFFDSGNINTILKSPKFVGFIRLNPHELFALELNLGYQNQTYGIVAYETENASDGEEAFIRTRKLLYQENFHEASLGTNLYFQKQINNISQLGFHIGLNYNRWIPGVFMKESGGVNDGELLEDFHDYLINNLDAEEWNKNVNPDGDKGLFSKDDYYNFNYTPNSDVAQQNSYHTDFSDFLLDTPAKRSSFELRLGIDYYLENLKFSLYAERSVWKKKFLYNDLLSLGMSLTMFLN